MVPGKTNNPEGKNQYTSGGASAKFSALKSKAGGALSKLKEKAKETKTKVDTAMVPERMKDTRAAPMPEKKTLGSVVSDIKNKVSNAMVSERMKDTRAAPMPEDKSVKTRAKAAAGSAMRATASAVDKAKTTARDVKASASEKISRARSAISSRMKK